MLSATRVLKHAYFTLYSHCVNKRMLGVKRVLLKCQTVCRRPDTAASMMRTTGAGRRAVALMTPFESCGELAHAVDTCGVAFAACACHPEQRVDARHQRRRSAQKRATPPPNLLMHVAAAGHICLTHPPTSPARASKDQSSPAGRSR